MDKNKNTVVSSEYEGFSQSSTISSIREIPLTYQCMSNWQENTETRFSTLLENNNREEVFEFTNPTRRTKIVDKFKATYDFVNQREVRHRPSGQRAGGERVRMVPENCRVSTLPSAIPRRECRSEGR